MRNLERGMSLGETAVAAVLLALVIMVVLTLFPDSMALVQRNRQESAARYAAQNELERTAAQPFDTIALGTQAIDSANLPENCSGSLTVNTVEDISETRLKSLLVEVTYASPRGPRTVSESVYVHSVRR